MQSIRKKIFQYFQSFSQLKIIFDFMINNLCNQNLIKRGKNLKGKRIIQKQYMLKTAAKQYKFVLVGDSAVGKSSLLNRFVDRNFSESLLSTIGVDFKFKRVKIDNNEIKLQIWDTAGQQTFRSIVSAYYTSADAIVIVYDITSYESFENVKSYWIEEAENNNKNNARIFLVGNKVDQESRRQVQKFTIDAFIEEHSIDSLYEASAKTGHNVQQLFTNIARNLFFGTKQKQQSSDKSQKNSKNKSVVKGVSNQSNHKSVNQNQEQKNRQDEYEEVVSVENDVNQYQGERRGKQERIKIDQNPSGKAKPKNPNYNKSCCLK